MRAIEGTTELSFAAVVQRAWSDPVFKAKLLEDGNAALSAIGAQIRPGLKVKVLENTTTTIHLVLAPESPEELSEGELDGVAGGLIDPNLPGAAEKNAEMKKLREKHPGLVGGALTGGDRPSES